jgi:flap endonuclease-1
MGTQIKSILDSREISIDELKGKTLAVDSYNLLYQFITTIRGRDGSLLMDSNGNVTSHLVGIFSRITKMMQEKIRFIFVFDGEPPKLKQKERERRKELKIDAEKKYQKAVKEENIDDMKKYASRTSRLTKEMIDDAKELIKALGLPIVKAPSEGEAQAAYMVRKKDADYCVSQDFDTILFGCPALIRNLSIAGKRKKTGVSYESVNPEIINLSDNLNKLGIDQKQLIVLGMLVGTDYNKEGIKGIGPKNALKLVKEYGSDFESLFKKVNWDEMVETSWEEIFDLFVDMPVKKDYKLEWKNPDKEKLIKILVDKHDFSMERVKNTIEKLLKKNKEKQQKGLGDFF